MVILGKLVHSVSINAVLFTVKLLRWFIVCQETAVTPDVALTIPLAQANKKASNRKYLLKVTQTVWYLARPGWPLQEDGNESDSNFPSFSFFVEIMIQR